MKARLAAVSEEVHQHKQREGSLREVLRRELEDRHCLDTKERNLEYESRIKVPPLWPSITGGPASLSEETERLFSFVAASAICLCFKAYA